MTKNSINEEALYQQFLNELAEGEQEYDRIMEAGEAPAQQKATAVKPRIVALRPYLVAASIALLMVIGAGVFYNINNEEGKPLVASVGENLITEPSDSVPAKAATDEPKAEQPAKKASKVKQMIKVNEDVKMYLAENTVGVDKAEMQLTSAEPTEIIQTEADFPILNPQALILSEEEIAKAEQIESNARRRWLLEQYKAIQAQAEEILAMFEDEEN